jgi:hypothetical protein
MRVWKLKDLYRDEHDLSHHDLVCLELGENTLLFIQEEGTWDLSHVYDGLPTDGMWDLIVGGDE